MKFGSNFQPFIRKRDVKHGDDDFMTREPEMVQAYRDTWDIGIHSYLTYLRDRFLIARELLTESGSIFVQISDENVHHVRELMDEVFGAENFVTLVAFKKTGGQSSNYLGGICDYIILYAKQKVKGRLFLPDNLTSEGKWSTTFEYEFEGRKFFCGANNHWKTNLNGLEALKINKRLISVSTTLYYVRYLDDFPVTPIDNLWYDTVAGGYSGKKVYVVQTNAKVIERCLLLATDPGDLVLDPHVAQALPPMWQSIGDGAGSPSIPGAPEAADDDL